MAEYSKKIGTFKSIQNTLVALVPAGLAGWAAFAANVPTEYVSVVTIVTTFISFFARNWTKNR